MSRVNIWDGVGDEEKEINSHIMLNQVNLALVCKTNCHTMLSHNGYVYLLAQK